MAAPLFFLGLLELGLRLGHYGPDLSLLQTRVIGGHTYHTMNPDVKWRYFARVPFSPSTSPDFFLLPKPAGTFRIFCLGGSTTVGYPYWFNGSFSSFLRDRLRAIFAGKQIEVINMGMTATNSFTTLDFGRELVECQPDLIIVYDGHNEFYGALGAASNESPGGARWIVNLYLRLIHFKSFLLLRDTYNSLAGLLTPSAPPDPHATMMEKLARGHYIPLGSPAYRSALSSFEGNLTALRSICEKQRIPIVFATQVSNLRSQPPFVSGDPPGSTPAERSAFEAQFRRGVLLREQGKSDSALGAFRSLLLRDSARAETHFQIARCLDTLSRRHEAEVEYVRARDLDQLRFRTSTDFNAAIAGMADGNETFVVDMERTFRENSPDSLIGNELIVEHLHPNSRGYFLMAKAFTGAMRRHGLLADAREWAGRDTLGDGKLWEDRGVTQIDELMAKRSHDVLVSGWPFTQHEPTVPAIPSTDTLGQVADRMTRGLTTWTDAHETAAMYYRGRGELHEAAREYTALLREVPFDVEYYLRLGQVFMQEGKTAEARAVLSASLPIEKTSSAYRGLGDLFLQSGKPVEAIAAYQQAASLHQTAQERVETGYVLSLAYLRANMPELCITELQRVLAQRPDFKQAQELLATIRRIQEQQKQQRSPLSTRR